MYFLDFMKLPSHALHGRLQSFAVSKIPRISLMPARCHQLTGECGVEAFEQSSAEFIVYCGLSVLYSVP